MNILTFLADLSLPADFFHITIGNIGTLALTVLGFVITFVKLSNKVSNLESDNTEKNDIIKEVIKKAETNEQKIENIDKIGTTKTREYIARAEKQEVILETRFQRLESLAVSLETIKVQIGQIIKWQDRQDRLAENRQNKQDILSDSK